jgi:hypothetical protein
LKATVLAHTTALAMLETTVLTARTVTATSYFAAAPSRSAATPIAA